jgi:hypothetical protein
MPENKKRVVKMFWADRLGNKSAAYQATLGHTIDQVSNSSTGELHTALWYSFNRTETQDTLVDPTLGVSKIWFTVTEKGRTKTYDQGGIGFAIQDTLLLRSSSCFSVDDRDLVIHLKVAVSTYELEGSRTTGTNTARCDSDPKLRPSGSNLLRTRHL